MERFNRDIWREICRHLRYRDVSVFSRLNRDMRSIISTDDEIWKEQYEKTWWPREAEDYPGPIDIPGSLSSWLIRLSGRISHIRKILCDEPVVNLFLYRFVDSNGQIGKDACHHKINLKRRTSQLVNQIAMHNNLTDPFGAVVHLPGGRIETFYSNILKRHAKPLYYTIGIEYAVHDRGKPDDDGVRNRIPYETLISFRDVPCRDKEGDRRNRGETMRYHLNIDRKKKI